MHSAMQHPGTDHAAMAINAPIGIIEFIGDAHIAQQLAITMVELPAHMMDTHLSIRAKGHKGKTRTPKLPHIPGLARPDQSSRATILNDLDRSSP